MGYSKDDLQVMAVKQFNHTLFANRPVIKVKVLAFHAIQDYRIPVGLKIKTTELAVRRTEIASIATILEGDVNRFRVLSGRNAENWWQHRLVQNAKELITEGSPSAEKSCLMLRTFGNKIIRFNNTLKRMRTEKNCELIESWMSVKREVGSELWFALRFKNCSENVLEMMQTRMEVISIDERCVRILGEKGTQVEVCVDKTSHVRWGKPETMKNQPVLYDSLKSILHHMDANLRINMSTQIPSIRATERAVPLKMKCLSFSDTSVKINDVCYELSVYRDYPNGDVLPAGNDFDRFGFEIPFDPSPTLPGDVSLRNRNGQVVRTDTDELEEHYQTQLARCKIILQFLAQQKPGVTLQRKDVWIPWMSDYVGITEKRLQYISNDAREKLKPFLRRRHNLPRPFFCYIQLSIMKDGEAKSFQRLAYTRKLYEAVKQFNHILFAKRPAIRVIKPVFLDNHVYRIPVGFKMSANELTVRESQVASIATMIEDVNRLRVSEGGNTENWWQHRFVKNAKELITKGSPSVEESCLMLRTFRCRIIRFHNLRTLTSEQYCELIESWMSVKREVGSELWIALDQKKRRKNVSKMMQTRMEIIRRDDRNGTQVEASMANRLKDRWQNRLEVFPKDERSFKLRGKNGTQIEICGEVCENETMRHCLKVKIIGN
ncbi:hypothetical protein B9Z55_007776 [Caenorhabditis nigoni]|nr:hypothetical protein B9Z55_007776 [Caenorhabditis nigoni]